jgi:hypothetical protein
VISAPFITVALLASTIGNHPVARVGSDVIMYEAVHCDVDKIRPSYPAASDEMLAETCKRFEQDSLDRIVSPRLIDSAVALFAIAPSRDEVAKATPAVSGLNSVARRYEIQAQALRRVMDGASEGEVRRDLLDPNGISAAEFAGFRALFHNRQQLDAFQSRDYVADMRRTLEEGARIALCVSRVHNYIVHMSELDHVSYENQLSEISDCVESAVGGVEILDEHFTKPTLERILRR